MRDWPKQRPVGGSRREFLGWAVAANGALLAGGVASWADEADPRIKEVLAKTITVDMHNHASFGETPTAPSLQNRPPAKGAARRDPSVAEAMQRAGDTAICMAYAVDGELMGGAGTAPGTRSNLSRDPKPGEMYQAHLKYLDQVDALLAKNQLQRALKYGDMEAAHEQGLQIVIQDAEGADFLEKGHLDRLGDAYRRGLRKLQFVHYAVNDIGDFQTGPVEHHGLSPFGAEVVKECDRLGIVVDVAHGTFDTVKGVVKASSRPLVLSHTALAGSKAQGTFWAENFRGGLPAMQARQVTPDHAKAVAETNGVVGIWHLFPSAEKYVQGVREMVDVVGADHVGIGMDWPIEGINFIWPGQTEGMMYTVIGEMLKQGFTPEECGKIAGANFCRVFKACV